MKTIKVRPVYIYFSDYDHRPSAPLHIALYFKTNSFNPVPNSQNEKKTLSQLSTRPIQYTRSCPPYLEYISYIHNAKCTIFC